VVDFDFVHEGVLDAVFEVALLLACALHSGLNHLPHLVGLGVLLAVVLDKFHRAWLHDVTLHVRVVLEHILRGGDATHEVRVGVGVCGDAEATELAHEAAVALDVHAHQVEVLRVFGVEHDLCCDFG